jgi:multidrug efflux pump
MTTIDNTLYDAFGQRQVASIYQGLNQYHVVMEADPLYSGKPEALNNSTCRWAARSPHPPAPPTPALGSNAASGSAAAPAPPHRCRWPPWRMELGSTAASVSHSDGEPSATVSFNLPPGLRWGRPRKPSPPPGRLHLPATVHGDFGGTAKVFQQSTSSTPLLIVAALVTIYIVLGMLYESAIHPLTVLSTLPSAGWGDLLADRHGGSSTSSR